MRNAPARVPAVPIHRGPQAIPAAMLGTPYQHAPNAALLIDFDNVTMGIRSDLQTELRSLLSSDIVKGKVSVQRAYADWRRYPQYIVPLSESSIDLIFAPAYGSAKKNATDIRLAIDALELVFTRPEIGTFILLSGDSDFSSLVIKLKEYGKYVIGVGIRESSSDLLVQNCDEYYSYNALAGLVKSGDEETRKWDPWELVTEAVGRMKKNGDVMRSDRLKQVMQEIDSSFDEKNLGMAKFSRFCIEAAHKGLLHVTKLENGQLEVDLPSAAKAAGIEGAAPRALEAGPRIESAPAEDRGPRRGRGRGRGRDRDRDRGAPVVQASVDGPLFDGAVEPIAAVAVAEAPRRDQPAPRTERMDRAERPERAPAPMSEERRLEIGVSGERLTRNEAFDLLRRSVESLTTADESVGASAVRERAYKLLGRDSESLSERFFDRILRDAHDANVIDLRRRGDGFEVGRVVEVASVSDQLSTHEATAASTAAAASAAAAGPPPPRGMGHRGVGGRSTGRGRPSVAKIAPPPDMLLVGVVAPSSSAVPAAPAASVSSAPAAPAVTNASSAPAAPVAALAAPQSSAPAAGNGEATPPASAPATTPAPSAGRRGRGRGGAAKKAAVKKTAPVVAATQAPVAKTAPAKPPARGRKSAAKSPAKVPAKSAAAAPAAPSRGGGGRGRKTAAKRAE
jgi:uncharacterized protein (TIGR00288 family)